MWRLRDLFSTHIYTHTHWKICSCVQLQANGYRSQLHQTDDEWQEAEEREKGGERRSVRGTQSEAVFQSHLANSCHWWIQMPHHSLSLQLQRFISTAANEINTGLLCASVCVFCICMYEFGLLFGSCIKQSWRFRAASLGWMNVYISFCGDWATGSCITNWQWKIAFSLMVLKWFALQLAVWMHRLQKMSNMKSYYWLQTSHNQYMCYAKIIC